MNKNLIDLAFKLKKFNNKFINKKLRYVTNRSVDVSKLSFFFHFLLYKDFIESPYRNILINYFNKSEKLYPGSSYFVSKTIVDKIHGINRNTKKVLADKTIDNLIAYMHSIAEPDTVNKFIDVLRFSGPNSTITCEPTKNIDIIVEKTSYPKVPIFIDESFRDMYFTNIKTTTKNVVFSVVDGFIERESEIIPLLEEAKKNKLPVVIVCRGISEVAKNNLKKIALKNNIYVYPYICKFDNEDPFLLKDINELAGTKILSAEFGDAIYKDIVKKSKIIKIKLSSNCIVFYKGSDKLIDDINVQLKSCDDSVKSYLQKRKSRAVPNNINIKIPIARENLLKDFKRMIVCYNFCAISGFYLTENNEIISKQCDDVTKIMSDRLFDTLTKIGLVIKIKNNSDSKKAC